MNDKERILKAIDGGRLEPTREIPLDYDQICSVETLKAGSEWDKIYKILRKTSSEEWYIQQSYFLHMKEK